MTKKKDDIKCSVPKGMEYNTSYTLNPTKSKYYWETDRNKSANISFSEKLDIEVKGITELLKSKNKAYGNTALNPTNVFSSLDATEAICARIDDKLARIKNKGINDKTEDTVDDLIGYLLLLKMSL